MIELAYFATDVYRAEDAVIGVMAACEVFVAPSQVCREEKLGKPFLGQRGTHLSGRERCGVEGQDLKAAAAGAGKNGIFASG